MAVRSMEELLNTARGVIGESSNDEALALLDDITDTISDLETKATPDGINWKQRYEENDASWRKKYRDRFFSADDDGGEEPAPPPSVKKHTFESLFKEE